MSAPYACQTCGTVLLPDASPGGLCAACLLAQVLSGGDDAECDDGRGSDLAPGTAFGAFLIEAVLGRGGMSTVYRAHESALDRVVALKVLPPEFLHDTSFARRFQREARMVAALEHPHIVPLYATGFEGGTPWMSMRLMDRSLASVMAQERLEVRRAVDILRAVAAALDYAHERGVVHRDVKPSNILLDRAGHVCVGDFGLAHLVERSLAQTQRGVIAGTPHYMAPEQALGHDIDRHADIYALGVVAFEMLAGTPPYDADSPVALLMKHVADPVPSPPEDVPAGAVAVLRRALAKEPTRRWPTATALVEALEQAIATPSSRRAVSPVYKWAAGAGVITAALGMVLLIPRAGRDAQLPAAAEEATPIEEVADAPGTGSSTAAPLAPPPTLDAEPRRQPSEPAVRTAAPRPEAPVSAASGRAPVDAGSVAVSPSPATSTSPDAPAPAVRNTTDIASAEAAAEAAPPLVGHEAAGDAVSSTAEARRDVVVQPVRLRTASPAYPPLALAAQIQGDVVVQALVAADGRVAAVEVLQPVHPLLDAAAREAVLQYVYTPGTRNGAPEAFPVQVTVSFKIE